MSIVFNYLCVNSWLSIRQFLITMILELQHFLMRVCWKVLHLRIVLGGGRGRRSKSFFRIMGVHLMGGKSSQAWTLSKGKLLFLHLQLLQFCEHCTWNVLLFVGWSTFFVITELWYEASMLRFLSHIRFLNQLAFSFCILLLVYIKFHEY